MELRGQNRVLFGLLTFATAIVLVLLSVFAQKAHAASYSWDGGGGDNNWSTCANWSTNVCPAAGDTVTFDATSTKNSTVDPLFNASETIVTINVNSGYTGTITLGTTLHVTTSFVQHAGTFTASNQTLDLNGSMTLDAGTFTASSGSTTLAGAMTISGSPTFNHNSGTFTFDGTTTATLSCNNTTFNVVSFAHTTGTKTVSSNCNLPLGNNPSLGSSAAVTTLNGTLSGSGTLTAPSTFNLNSTGVLSGFTGLADNGAFTQTGGNQNFGSYTTFDMNGTFSLSTAGIFTAPSGTATFAAGFTLSAGTTFNANGGTVTFDGTGAGTLACNNAAFNLVTFAHTTNVIKTVGTDCSLPLGANPTIGNGSDVNADLTLNGTLTGTGTLKMGAANSANLLTLNSTAVLSGFSGLNAGALTTTSATVNFGSYTTFALSGSYAQSGGTITVPNGADYNGSFVLSASGVFNAPGGTATFASTFTLNTGTTFNANGGTVSFDGSGSGTLACNNATFNLVTFVHTGGVAKTVGSDCSLPLGANPTIGNGSDVNADLTLNGTLTGTGTLKMGAANSGNLLTLNSTAVLSGFTGLNAGSVTTTSAAVNFSTYTTFTLSGNYSQSGGTMTIPSGAMFNATFTVNTSGVLNAPSGTATFASTFTLSAGTTFNANGGTVTFSGTTNIAIACGNATFNLVTFIHTASTKTVGSDCNLPLGNNPTVGNGANNSLTLNGTLSGTGTLKMGTLNANTLTLNTTAALSGFSGLNGNILTVTGAAINFGAYTSFALNGAYAQSGGTITVPNGADFNSTFVLSASGIFNAPSGTATFASTFTLNAGTTFNANGGTVTFDGTTAANIACNNTTFNLVTFAHTTNVAKTVGSDCNLPLGNNPTLGADANADVTLNGTLSGTGTLTLGTTGTSNVLTINSTGVISGFSGLNGGGLTTSGITANYGAYTTFSLTGAYSQTGGTATVPNGSVVRGVLTLSSGAVFNAPSGMLTIYSNLTINTGTTYNANGGTLTLAGSNSLTCNNAVFSHVIINATGNVSVPTGCTLPLDNTNIITNDLSLTGTIINTGGSGSITANGCLFLNTPGHIEGFKSAYVGNCMNIFGSSWDFGDYTSLIVNKDFNDFGGTFKAPSGSMEVRRNFKPITGFDANNGTVNLTGPLPDNFVFVDCGVGALNKVDINYTYSANTINIYNSCNLPLGNNPIINASLNSIGKLSGTGTLTFTAGTLELGKVADGNTGSGSFGGFTDLVTNDLVIDGKTADFSGFNSVTVKGSLVVKNGGSFIAPPQLNVAGNFSILDTATFNHNNGTVVLNGSNQTIIGTTFANLTKEASTAATLTLPAGSTETILGNLKLKGAAGQMLSILSSVPGVDVLLNLQGTADVCYANVTDTHNTGSNITAYNSTSNSTNTGWTFSGRDCVVPPVVVVSSGNISGGVLTAIASDPILDASATITIETPSHRDPLKKQTNAPTSSPVIEKPKNTARMKIYVGVALVSALSIVGVFFWLPIVKIRRG